VLHIGHTFRRRLNGSAGYSFLAGTAAGRTIFEQGKGPCMSDSDDFTAMNDPDFPQDDVLETCLYIPRNRLQGKADDD
jgi:hypothetical protein